MEDPIHSTRPSPVKQFGCFSLCAPVALFFPRTADPKGGAFSSLFSCSFISGSLCSHRDHWRNTNYEWGKLEWQQLCKWSVKLTPLLLSVLGVSSWGPWSVPVWLISSASPGNVMVIRFKACHGKKLLFAIVKLLGVQKPCQSKAGEEMVQKECNIYQYITAVLSCGRWSGFVFICFRR